METALLLQRQMELHGTLRHPPRNKEDLENVHKTIQDLVDFFIAVRSKSEKLRTPPETLFQCLMHIGLGDAVNFDKQRRDGAVPMHQAKVLTRASAIDLEPRLRAAVSPSDVDTMVSLSKVTRSLLRMKVEDANDFVSAERALRQSLEYLRFIDAAACRDAERMYAFYMVEDEASLRSLLHGGAGRGAADHSDDCALLPPPPPPPPLPPAARFCDDCAAVARQAATASLPAADRLCALRTLCHWLSGGTVEEEGEEGFGPQRTARLAAGLAAPLATCAGEKRSAICRLACTAIETFASRVPFERFADASVRAALKVWCEVLMRGVFVTVATIAKSSDSTVRVLVRRSGGDAAALRSILAALEAGSQPELRRKAIAYLALGVVAARGAVCVEVPGIQTSANTYVGVGDSACRRMARALAVAIEYFTGTRAMGLDKKAEALMREEKRELGPLLDDVEAFENALFTNSKTQGELSGSTSSIKTASSSVQLSTGASSRTDRLVRDSSLREESSSLPYGSSVSKELWTPMSSVSGDRPLKLSASLRQKINAASPQHNTSLR